MIFAAEILRVEQIDLSFFRSECHQGAPVIREHHRTARPEVEVSRIEFFLIDRSERVLKASVFTETDYGTSPSAACGVISAICGLSEHTERSLHNPAAAPRA